MFDHSKVELTNKERVEVLFKEYDTLRAEIIGRTVGGFQLIAIIALLVSGLIAWVGAHPITWVFWIWLFTLVAASVFFYYIAYRETNAAARRIGSIETQINELLGDEKLLQWESRFGGAVTGWIIKRSPNR